MRLRRLHRLTALLLGLGFGLAALYYLRAAYSQDSDPQNEKAEFYWSRLRYTSSAVGRGGGGFGFGYGGYGYGYAGWARDYPKADRQFLLALKRLTRIQMRPVEQIVDLNSDDIFNYPWVYAVQVANWTFTDAQAKRLREYLLKGGFLMVDDFHGTADWDRFMAGMRQVLPDLPVPDVRMRRTVMYLSGARFATRRGESLLRFVTTCTLAMPGSGRICRSIPKALRRWRTGWVSTTSSTA
jgi:hypothetical protein